MRTGLFLNTQLERGQDPVAAIDQLLEQVDAASRLGFDCVLAGQHFLAHPYAMFAPIPLLARVAAVAGAMRVGTGVALAPHAHPVALAEEVATMDAITRGRFILGLGLGYRKVEFEAFGIPDGRRAETLERHLSVLTALLEGKATDFGAWGRDVALSLPPLQRPRPPIWLAANNAAGIRRAAQRADAWLINPHARLNTLEPQVEQYATWRREAGRSVGELPLIREVCTGDDEREAFATARKYLEPKYRAYVDWGQHRALPRDDHLDVSFDELAEGRFVIGSRETCTSVLQEYRARLGVDLVILRPQWPGMPAQRAMETIELVGESVMPKLREAA